jgi:SAM-dependent methyltransferase
MHFYSQPAKYDPWLAEERARDTLWKRRLKKMASTRRPGSLLDVGTGIGQFLHHAQPLFSDVCGTEVSESALRIAKEKYNLDVMRGEIGSIQFGATTFDNITLFHVLEHVPDPGAVIERCKSLLASDGILVIAVPNDILWLRKKATHFAKRLGVKRAGTVGVLGLSRITLDGSLAEIHLSHFTPAVLQKVVEAAGFAVVENGLDPYWAARGMKAVVHRMYYRFCILLKWLTGKNFYDAIWLVARKKEPAVFAGT